MNFPIVELLRQVSPGRSGSQRKSGLSPWQRNSKCKGPEAGLGLVRSEQSKEASVWDRESKGEKEGNELRNGTGASWVQLSEAEAT